MCWISFDVRMVNFSIFSLICVWCFLNLCYAATSCAAIWSTVLLCYIVLASSSIPTIHVRWLDLIQYHVPYPLSSFLTSAMLRYPTLRATVFLCYVILASSSIPTIYDVLSYDKLLNDYISLKAASLYPVLTIDFFVSSQLRSPSHTSLYYYANASDVLRQFRPCNWQWYTIIYARLSATITPYAATNSTSSCLISSSISSFFPTCVTLNTNTTQQLQIISSLSQFFSDHNLSNIHFIHCLCWISFDVRMVNFSLFSLICVWCFLNLCYVATSCAAIWSTVLLCYVVLASSSIPTIHVYLSDLI